MRMMISGKAVLVALVLAAPTLAADVTGFRGPGGVAVSDEAGLPAEWSSTKNVAWKTRLPGPGTSSPIVLGERIYITSYSGYGLEPNQGSQSSLQRHVLCLDRKSGKLLWKKDFKPQLPESRYSGGNNARHGYADDRWQASLRVLR